MNITLIIRTAGIGMLVAVVSMVLSRSGREEQAMLVSIAGVVVVLVMLMGEISGLIGTVRSVFGI